MDSSDSAYSLCSLAPTLILFEDAVCDRIEFSQSRVGPYCVPKYTTTVWLCTQGPSSEKGTPVRKQQTNLLFLSDYVCSDNMDYGGIKQERGSLFDVCFCCHASDSEITYQVHMDAYFNQNRVDGKSKWLLEVERKKRRKENASNPFQHHTASL